MSQALADSLRGEDCIVVNNAYQLAPWAMALCAQDHQWWRVHKEAMNFLGKKYSANKMPGITQIFSEFVQRQSSSGVLAVVVAWRIYKPHTIYLHGFNNSGTHYFGPHPAPLQNTEPNRFKYFADEFKVLGSAIRKAGIRVINATPDSALECFERGTFSGSMTHASTSPENA